MRVSQRCTQDVGKCDGLSLSGCPAHRADARERQPAHRCGTRLLNQIVDVFPWLRSAAFRNARHEADKEHEGCPTAAPVPRGGRPLFTNVPVRRRHSDGGISKRLRWPGDRCAVVLPRETPITSGSSAGRAVELVAVSDTRPHAPDVGRVHLARDTRRVSVSNRGFVPMTCLSATEVTSLSAGYPK